MLRTTQSFLKGAAEVSRSSVLTKARRSHHLPNHFSLLYSRRAISTNASSPPLDYDHVMHAAVSNVFPSAGDASAWPPPSSYSPGSSEMVKIQVPFGMGAATQNHNVAIRSSFYQSINESTGCEDYDSYELHHPPCEKTQETHICYGASYDPSALEVGGEMLGSV